MTVVGTGVDPQLEPGMGGVVGRLTPNTNLSLFLACLGVSQEIWKT